MPAWIRPTKTTKISDDFHDHTARGSVNPGVDYVVGTGTPVFAVADAVVSGVTTTISGAGGRMVWLNFGNGYCADYLHLSRVDVKKGDTVKQGQVLGLSGGSGRGSEKGYGAHLHFSFRVGSKHVQGRGNVDYEAFLAKNGVKGVAPIAAAAGGRATVKKGSSGADVKYLQQKLGILDDGIFGNQTKAAVVAFQKSRSLAADGIVGPMTWKAIG